MQIFETKIRKVGTSFGVLIPKEGIVEDHLKDGSKVSVAILKKDFSLINKLAGSVKARPFVRDHSNRF